MEDSFGSQALRRRRRIAAKIALAGLIPSLAAFGWLRLQLRESENRRDTLMDTHLSVYGFLTAKEVEAAGEYVLDFPYALVEILESREFRSLPTEKQWTVLRRAAPALDPAHRALSGKKLDDYISEALRNFEPPITNATTPPKLRGSVPIPKGATIEDAPATLTDKDFLKPGETLGSPSPNLDAALSQEQKRVDELSDQSLEYPIAIELAFVIPWLWYFLLGRIEEITTAFRSGPG